MQRVGEVADCRDPVTEQVDVVQIVVPVVESDGIAVELLVGCFHASAAVSSVGQETLCP